MPISITDPINQAINRAGHITFKPFNLGKWFVLGFIAFLDGLGGGGGGGGSWFPGGGGGGGGGPGGAGRGTGSSPFDELTGLLSSHLAEVIAIGLFVVVMIMIVGLLVLWISSRARFMFLEAIATNTYEVVAPWGRYRHLGNSLCAFRICLGMIGLLLIAAIVGGALLIAWPDIHARRFEAHAISAILVGVVVLLPTGLILSIVNWCTNSFVTTIMYAGNLTVLPAWSEFRANVARGNVGRLVLFFLMQLVLSIAVGIASLMAGCLTCCIGLLPYLSSVVTLPLLVFNRCYPVYFLQQFDPRYVIIREPPPPAAFPVLEMPQQP